MNMLSDGGKGGERIFTRPVSDRPSSNDPVTVIGLREIAQIFRRRRRVLGLFMVFGTLLAAFAAYSLEDRYTAQSTLVLEYKDTRLSVAASDFESFNLSRTALKTELDLFQSREFAGRIVDSLNLLQDPRFNGYLPRERSSDMHADPRVREGPPIRIGYLFQSARQALEIVGLASPKGTAALPPRAVQRERAISVLLSKVAVSNAGESLAITIGVTHTDPKKTALIANAMVDSYVQRSLERKRDAINRAIVFLRQRASVLGGGVAEIERKLADHIRAHQLDDKNLDASLRARIRKLKAQLQLLNEPNQASSGLAPDQNRAQALESQLENLEKQLGERTLAEVRRLQLEREILTDSNRHSQVVERLANLDSKIDVLNPSARVVSHATTPFNPSHPKRGLIIFGGFAGSVILGFMVSILLEGLDSRIHSEEQLTAITGLQNLGVVPFVSLDSPFGRRLLHVNLINKPHSHFAEELRSLYCSLLRIESSGSSKIVMLTSCWPNEGKSTVSVGLAVTAAMNGYRTAFLDLDLRTRGASKALMLPDEGIGIENYLNGDCSLDDVSRKDCGVEGLDVFPSVSQKGSSVRLMNSERLAAMLPALRSDYDFIVIDTPPAMLVNDLSMSMPLADIVLLVVRVGQTTTSAVKAVVKRLGLHKARLIGTLLNGEISRIHNYYGYRGKYYENYTN